jgi:hypothetical protein
VKKQCPRCGAVQPSWNWHCRECGLSFLNEKAEYVAPYDQPTRERTHKGYLIKCYGMAIGIVAMLLILALLMPFCSSTINITVHSTHMDRAVHYQVLINDNVRAEGEILPLNNVNWEVTEVFAWSFSGQDLVTIKATSYDGALGNETDSMKMTLVSGNTYSVTLEV